MRLLCISVVAMLVSFCKPKEIRNARLDGVPKREHSKRLLGGCWEWNTHPHHYKRKTCTPWILWYIRGVQVSALFMIEPPCTDRYARWCERSADLLRVSLLLDRLVFKFGFIEEIHAEQARQIQRYKIQRYKDTRYIAVISVFISCISYLVSLYLTAKQQFTILSLPFQTLFLAIFA